MTRNRTLTLAAMMSALALAGCQTQTRKPIIEAAPAGVEGDWVGAEGLISSFNDGSFQTKTTDTGEVIATGSYTERNGNLVEINVQSRMRPTRLVNCLKVSHQGDRVVQLNCSSATGTQFVLRRG